MRLHRLLRIVLAPLALAIVACESPTAPQFLAATDRFERSLADDPGAADRLSGLLGDQNVSRHLPALGTVQLTVDGRASSYRGFVMELVVVPLDAADGYPCPRLRRTLYAIGGDREGIVLTGADFTRPITSRWPGCRGLYYATKEPYWQLPWAPTAHGYFGGVERESLAGVDGRARIEPVFAGGSACAFFSPADSSSAPFRADCELVDFEIELDVRFARVSQETGGASYGPGDDPRDRATPPAVLGRPLPVAARAQTVPGIRMTVYCREGLRYGGCPVVD
jgi:hypothetical protein